MNGVSFAGGADLVIAGYGFSTTPSYNQIMLTTASTNVIKFTASETVTLAGTPLTGKYPDQLYTV